MTIIIYMHFGLVSSPRVYTRDQAAILPTGGLFTCYIRTFPWTNVIRYIRYLGISRLAQMFSSNIDVLTRRYIGYNI